MIDFIRSYFDQISLEALKYNLMLWLLIYLVFFLISYYFKNSKSNLMINRFSKYRVEIIFFILTYIVIRTKLKSEFIEKFLNF